MPGDPRLKVVLCWHMHQPEYRDGPHGDFTRPWTYLHAIKDYVDMAAHLEAAPAARAVVNFSPVLLEQIEDYARQLERALADGRPVRDAVLRGLQEPPPRDDAGARLALIDACRKAHRVRMVDRFPAYRRLVDFAGRVDRDPGLVEYLDDQFVVDMVMWYHLAWIGETVRRHDLRVKQLADKGKGFDRRDRRTLLELIAELISGLVPRWRRLAETGRVELSVSPYAHPILPLLIDWESAREASPDAPLPRGGGYRDGPARASWHLEEAAAVFERHFGARPLGCWPSEGAIGDAALGLIAEHGYAWAASGAGVLENSLAAARTRGETLPEDPAHRPWRVGDDASLRCFFRDDALSDLIGFTYADWHADDAVSHLVSEIEKAAGAMPDPSRRVLSIIMDGENAWESYPENGFHFLSALYEVLADHPLLELATYRDCLDADLDDGALTSVVAGSWVYGTLSTWIGDPQKNRGWELLADAADALARNPGLAATARARAVRQLAVCEGSDWCWWFGDYNPAASVSAFDDLYRRHLREFYHLIGQPAPEGLEHPISSGGGDAEAGGVMRRGTAT